MTQLSKHLQDLENQSLYYIREAVAAAENPALLYSIGKDSSVLLHLVRKAFAPAQPPLPLLHVDTTWKFREMIRFRDNTAKELGLTLITHTNEAGLEHNISPFDDSRQHTHIMKTEALKQLLDQHKFDFVLVGGRRDEEKSRAKERVFSTRNRFHAWEPRQQQPEFGWLFNTRLPLGGSMRVSPLSNWTELDIWQYIEAEQIPVVPLYFAAERPVVERGGQLIMVDDDRFEFQTGEVVSQQTVRFRTLGCYPLTAAVRSTARTVPDIITELQNSKFSERQGRLIDGDQGASMEKKKKQGYF